MGLIVNSKAKSTVLLAVALLFTQVGCTFLYDEADSCIRSSSRILLIEVSDSMRPQVERLARTTLEGMGFEFSGSALKARDKDCLLVTQWNDDGSYRIERLFTSDQLTKRVDDHFYSTLHQKLVHDISILDAKRVGRVVLEVTAIE